MTSRARPANCGAMPRGPGPVAAVHRIFIVTALAVGHGALGDLRTRTAAVVPGFPLGDDGAVDLVLTRFEPFAPGARVDVVADNGVHVAPLPDRAYFTGTVRGDPAERAFVAAG